MRQYSMEATAGKNPSTIREAVQRGRAARKPNKITKEVTGVREAYVRILSRIGSPIDQPQIASAAIVLEEGRTLAQVHSDVESILDESLADIRNVTNLILEQRIVPSEPQRRGLAGREAQCLVGVGRDAISPREETEHRLDVPLQEARAR